MLSWADMLKLLFTHPPPPPPTPPKKLLRTSKITKLLRISMLFLQHKGITHTCRLDILSSWRLVLFLLISASPLFSDIYKRIIHVNVSDLNLLAKTYMEQSTISLDSISTTSHGSLSLGLLQFYVLQLCIIFIYCFRLLSECNTISPETTIIICQHNYQPETMPSSKCHEQRILMPSPLTLLTPSPSLHPLPLTCTKHGTKVQPDSQCQVTALFGESHPCTSTPPHIREHLVCNACGAN